MNELRVHPKRTPKAAAAVLLLLPSAVLFLILPLYPRAPDLPLSASRTPTSSPPPPAAECDLSVGEWVPDPEAPYYNESCPFMDQRQNCMKNGRPDRDYLHWRWKPEQCELPAFEAAAFLELVRGKSMIFIGDSLARNHMHSLICLLTRVMYPNETEKLWFYYKEYNFSVTVLWSPYLVNGDPTGHPKDAYDSFHLQLDQPDPAWATQIESFDYVIFSSGRWFLDYSNYFYMQNKLIGCNVCGNASVPEVDFFDVYRLAFRTTFAYLNNLPSYKGITFLRTYSITHYDGRWDKGGGCPRTKLFRSKEMPLHGLDLRIHNIQVEELQTAKEVGAKRGLEFHLLDITRAMLLRPDGHPDKYGRILNGKPKHKDCVHWCLPGPIDNWGSIMLHILNGVKRREKGK